MSGNDGKLPADTAFCPQRSVITSAPRAASMKLAQRNAQAINITR